MLETISKTQVMPNADMAGIEAADRFVCQCLSAISKRGSFSTALPGGSTPKKMLDTLSLPDYRGRIPWGKVHLFQTDERHVPHDNKDSNYKMLKEHLLDNVPLPEENMHSFPVHLHHNKAAAVYQMDLIKVLGDPPFFDLLVLGVGADGHTASLFPGSDALDEEKAYAVACWAESISALRLTLTLPVIANAANAIFLVTGAHKADAVVKCIGSDEPDTVLPARKATLLSRNPLWILDQAAASELKTLEQAD